MLLKVKCKLRIKYFLSFHTILFQYVHKRFKDAFIFIPTIRVNGNRKEFEVMSNMLLKVKCKSIIKNFLSFHTMLFQYVHKRFMDEFIFITIILN